MGNVAKKPAANAGFSIIELSITLTVIALFVVNVFLIQDTAEEFKKSLSTYNKLAKIQETIDKFVDTHGYYPCPASGNLPLTDTNIGLGGRSEYIPTYGIYRCRYANYEIPMGVVNTQARYINAGFVGVVPVRDLSLPLDYMLDAWGNRITYGTRLHLTNPLTYMSSNEFGTPSRPKEAGRSLQIVYGNGNTGPEFNAAYVLLSHGANGYGAFNNNGTGIAITQPASCTIRRIPAAVDGGGVVLDSDSENQNSHIAQEMACPAPGVLINPLWNFGITPNIYSGVLDEVFAILEAPESNTNDPGAIKHDDLLLFGSQRVFDENPPPNVTQPRDGTFLRIPYYENMIEDNPSSPDNMGRAETPDAIPNLVLWFDAQDCDSIKLNSGANACTLPDTATGPNRLIREIYDKYSPYNNNTNNIGKSTVPGFPGTQFMTTYLAPANGINGAPAIGFNGVLNGIAVYNNTNFEQNNFPFVFDRRISAKNFTAFIVLRSPNVPKNLASIIGKGRADFSLGWGMNILNSGTLGCSGGDFCYAAWTAPLIPANVALVPANNNEIDLLVLSYDEKVPSNPNDSELVLRKGCASTLASTATSLTNLDYGSAGTYPLDDTTATSFLIGMRADFADAVSYNGDIAEIIFYNRVLEDYEREAITVYLARKWGVTNNTNGTCDINAARGYDPETGGAGTVPPLGKAPKYELDTDCAPGDGRLGESCNSSADCCGGFGSKSAIPGSESPSALNATTACMASTLNPGTNRCCILDKGYNRHYQKCMTNDDCCYGACSPHGFCYDYSILGDLQSTPGQSLPTNYPYYCHSTNPTYPDCVGYPF